MRRWGRVRWIGAWAVCLGLLVCGRGSLAQDSASPAETEAASDPTRIEWSATPMIQGKLIDPEDASDGIGDFFDQYEFTPNKSASFPIELGVRDASLDVFDGSDRPVFQLRLESPTSNLGVSGSEIDQPFFNQRIQTWTRGIELGDRAVWSLDLDYARMRTEALRIFPDTGGAGLVFDDTTSEDDRFFRDRTGFDGEIVRRSEPGLGGRPADSPGFVSEIALRGEYQGRNGLGQLRAHRDPTNDWLGLAQDRDRDLSGVGGGVLLGGARDGRFIMTFDFDYEQLRWKSQQLIEGDLGAAPPAATRTIGFVPDSDRFTPRVVAHGRVGDRGTWYGGWQGSFLRQSGELTPDQVAADMGDNRVTMQSIFGGTRWQVSRSTSVVARLEVDLRDNRIDRSSALFNPMGGIQVDPFISGWRRLVADTFAEWRFLRRNSLSAGVHYYGLTRDIEYAEPGGARVLPENSQVHDATRMVDFYAKARLRPARRLRVRGEVGYRIAPSTGYIADLGNFVHGNVDARWTLPTRRHWSLNAFLRGDSGSNDDFEMVEGLGPDPQGASVDRSLDRWSLGWGVGMETVPTKGLSIYASFSCGRMKQRSAVVLSSWQRYFQEVGTPPLVVLTFDDIGDDDYLDTYRSLIVGLHHEWSDRFDTGVSYAYTHSSAEFEGTGAPELDLLRAHRQLDDSTQVIGLEGGWRPREGLRLIAGYRLQYNGDDVAAPESNGSVVPPRDRDTWQQTFTIGATFDGRFFARDRGARTGSAR